MEEFDDRADVPRVFFAASVRPVRDELHLFAQEVGDLLDLPAADAFDAHIVTGGLPLICNEWPTAMPLMDYLGQAVSDPTSARRVHPVEVANTRTRAR